jgi:hypothetical protein
MDVRRCSSRRATCTGGFRLSALGAQVPIRQNGVLFCGTLSFFGGFTEVQVDSESLHLERIAVTGASDSQGTSRRP